MDHFTKFLVIPSLVAIPFQIVIFATNNYNSNLGPFYAWLLPMWSIFMLEVSLIPFPVSFYSFYASSFSVSVLFFMLIVLEKKREVNISKMGND
jgi:hypothetical protein